jgi:mannose-1-phosphate guanylyltransferase
MSNLTEEMIRQYHADVTKCLDAVPFEQLALVADRLVDAYRQGRLVAIMGNGGSAATASHMACDFNKKLDSPSKPFPQPGFRVMALTDSVPQLTALANDISYDAVFAEQVRTWMCPGDILIGISASGNSANICEAFKAARALGVYTIGLLGFGGGRAAGLVDLAVVVPSNDYGHVEDIHMMFDHMLTVCLRRTIANDTQAPVGQSEETEQAAPPKVLVLAAGEGTRLRPLTLECPKPMLPIAGKPLLEHSIEWLHGYGVNEIAVNLHYRSNTITTRMGDGSNLGVRLTYSYEDPLLGTAGAVRKLRSFFKDAPFVVVYGDVLTNLNLQALLAFHHETVQRDPATGVTLSLYHVPNPTEVGLVEMDSRGQITRFVEKPKPEEVFTDLANAGVMVVEPHIIERIPPDSYYDFGKHVFPQLLATGVPMYGWVIPDETYLLDIGTPEKYAQAQYEWPLRRRTAGWTFVAVA